METVFVKDSKGNLVGYVEHGIGSIWLATAITTDGRVILGRGRKSECRELLQTIASA